MIPISIVTEDLLSEEVTCRLLAESNRPFSVTARFPQEDRISASRGNSYIEKKIGGFNNAGRTRPFFVLLDLDTRNCAPVYIRQLLPSGMSQYLLLRIAVREVESWLLADREGFSQFLGIALNLVPKEPDYIPDPKKALFDLVAKSRHRRLREAILPTHSTARCGPDYNGTLIRYLTDKWDLSRAAACSGSLSRTVRALNNFAFPQS